DARAFPHQAFALPVRPFGVLFGNRRHPHHAAMAPFGTIPTNTRKSCPAGSTTRPRAPSSSRASASSETLTFDHQVGFLRQTRHRHAREVRADAEIMEAFAMSESDPRPFPVLDRASVEPRRGAAYPEHLRGPFAAREKRALGDPLGLTSFCV